MNARRVVLALLLAGACKRDGDARRADETTRTPMPTAPSAATDEKLSENLPTELAGQKVVVYNLWDREYTRADGTKVTGPAAVVSISDGKAVVEHVAGAGSRVTVGATTYDVVAVDATGGTVTLRAAR